MTQYELKKTDEVRKAALLHDSNRCKSAEDVILRAQMHFPAAQVTRIIIISCWIFSFIIKDDIRRYHKNPKPLILVF